MQLHQSTSPVTLASPIRAVPRLAKSKGFKGKKAAPFKKGGGRKQDHPNTAKGTPRKKASKKSG